MEQQFWQQRWRENSIGFHESEANPHLTHNITSLNLKSGAGVFVPLCGKTVDLDWLLTRGFRVVGAELNQGAVEAIFERLELEPDVQRNGENIRFSAPDIEIFVGDFFNLSAAQLGPVDGIYDRAALIALPQTMREAYAAHLMQLCPKAPQLLICLDYDQSQTKGPPFSVPEAEVKRLYSQGYDMHHLGSSAISGPLAKRCQGTEEVWLLTPEQFMF